MLHKRFKKVLKQLTALLCAICIFATGDIHVQAKDKSTAIGIGIDVSRYQNDIDWNAVAASGVQFSFIRVGSTKYGIDAKFHQNMIMANAAGIKTGVYIYSYALNAEQAAAEAMFVLNAVQNYTVNMPIVIDIEDSTQKALTPAQQSEIANTFCAIIESAGYYPMVYASKNWFLTRMGPIAYDKWVAQYNESCDIEDAAFWQATSSGVLPGIAGSVDIDYQYKDLSASIIPYGFLYRKGNFYFYENYKMKTNSFVNFDNGMFFVDEWGRRVTGFYPIGGNMYFFNQDGLMLTGLQTLAGNTYYFGLDGKMAIGLTSIGDQIFMFDTNGCMYRGWLSSDALYYFYDDGHMALGLSAIGTDYYYFDATGRLCVGWQDIAGAKYFFNPVGGKMMYGWINDGTGTFYTDSSGKMSTGIIVVDDAVYNMGIDGRMLFGWQTVNGADCFFDLTSGKMLTGWNIIGTDTYYFDPASGAKQTGWLNLNGSTYYLGADGKLRTGVQTIENAVYYFGTDGKLQTGFVSDGINTFYFDPATAVQCRGWTFVGTDTYFFAMDSGIMYTGLMTIGDRTYLFDASGKMLTGWQVIGGLKFYFGPDGAMMKGMINDGTGIYYLDPADGHLVTNTVLVIDNVTYMFDANGIITPVQ